MDGGEFATNYASKLETVTEGEWAGWSWYPGGDPYEDLAVPFYFRERDGRPVCAFRAEKKHMNGGGVLQGVGSMTCADFALFVIARQATVGSPTVTATFNAE